MPKRKDKDQEEAEREQSEIQREVFDRDVEWPEPRREPHEPDETWAYQEDEPDRGLIEDGPGIEGPGQPEPDEIGYEGER